MKEKDSIRKRLPRPKTQGKSNEAVVFQADLKEIEPLTVTTPVASVPRARKSPLRDEPIELFPHGISVASGLGRPVLILKDKGGVEVLPVWMQPLDAGVALAELSNGTGATPHTVVRRLFEAMGLRMESCVFTEVIGHHQFVDLTFRGASLITLPKVRADEAMSFCLQARAKFMATKAYMARCRSLDADITHFENNLNQGALPELKSDMEMNSKKHPYVM